jgi:O-antigen ligase
VAVYVAPADLRRLRPPIIGAQPGGDLVWAAAGIVTLGALLSGVALRDGSILLVAGICAAFGILFANSPMAGVAAMLIVRPSLDLWADRSIASVGSLSLNPASLMAVVFLAVGGAYVIERWEDVRQAPATKPYIFLAVMAVLSIAVAPSKGGAMTETLRFSSIAVIYMVVVAVVRDRRRLVMMVMALLASLIVPVSVALWQFAHGGSTVIGDVGRSAGTFLQPDPFGIFLGFMGAFLVALLLAPAIRGRLLLILATPLVLLALIASYTRTGWVGFVIGLIVIALVRYRGLIALAPIGLVLIAVAVPSTLHRFSDLNSGPTHYGPGNSLRARIDLWKQNLPKVEHDPILGTGFKSIVETTTAVQGGGVNVVQGAHSHSDFVRSLVELGVPGLVFFCWLLFGTWGACRRAYRRAFHARDPALAAVALGAWAATTAYIVMSADSNLMTQVAVAGTFWALAAVGHAAGWVELRPRPE